MNLRSKSRGAVLPIVLLLAAMMLVTASAWLQASLVAARTTVAARERMQAFHAADSALLRCSRMLSAALPATGAVDQEPARWRLRASFEGASALAVAPFVTWPYAMRAPQCLIEAWSRSGQSAAMSYLVTARGFGAQPQSEAWLQMRIDSADGVITQHWRRVVAKPF
ncbi:pilus assembly PilX N-terminal domain-containing protein [Caballeronia sp. LZ025]|uniref:pilus assembly PilX family protein n=1 Tax=Caballeronia TaxID=1827195 RepID=UPI001FD121DF|nr:MULTISPECIES: pilus assembly PilX N-terminal domain-containing protein [Caballeronia]MDR5732741.1 pilus assembly PilX N-terminal domain-containing protein [Caballeronia sp. LZ025]